MNLTPEPDPNFVNSLEWELLSAIRRQGALNGENRTNTRSVGRWSLGMVVVALAGVCFGSAGTFAVSRGLQSRVSDLLVARAELLWEVSDLRLRYLQEEFEETRARADEGAVSWRNVAHLALQRHQAEIDAKSCLLDLEETKLTGREPNNSLSAQLVNGQDFVSERLGLQQMVVHERLALIEDEVQQLEPGSNEHFSMVSARTAAAAELEALDKRLALRHAYLAGEMNAAEVELQDMRSTVELNRGAAVEHVRQLRKQFEHVQLLLEQAAVPMSHVRAIELDLKSADLQLRLADLELQILDRKLANSR